MTETSGVGDFVAGVYPLLQDETCWFLAVDFDKDSWADDWIFFSEPVPAWAGSTGTE